jgi:polyribonucleotide nucleotidyltransferase
VFELLAGLFPGEFASVRFDSRCLRSLSRSSLCDLLGTATAAADLAVDRANKTVRVSGADEDVLRYLETLNTAKREFEERRALVSVERSIVGALMGKRGAKLTALAEETGTNIQFDRDSYSLHVEAKGKDALAGALDRVQEVLAELEREYWEQALNEAHVGPFLGKGGASIKQLRTDTGASIDLQPNSRVVVVTGTEAQVADARNRILEFVAEQELSNFSCEVRVPEAALPAVVGSKGATIRDLQEKSGCHIDVNRGRGVAIMKGK